MTRLSIGSAQVSRPRRGMGPQLSGGARAWVEQRPSVGESAGWRDPPNRVADRLLDMDFLTRLGGHDGHDRVPVVKSHSVSISFGVIFFSGYS